MGWQGSSLSDKDNAVIVHVAELTEAVEAVLRERFGDRIRVVEGGAEVFQDSHTNDGSDCTQSTATSAGTEDDPVNPRCHPNLRGGLQIRRTSDNRSCTAGFVARNSAGAWYLVTAGHCSRNAAGDMVPGIHFEHNLPERTSNWRFVGGVPRTIYSGNVDAARIYITPGDAEFWRPSRWVYHDHNTRRAWEC